MLDNEIASMDHYWEPNKFGVSFLMMQLSCDGKHMSKNRLTPLFRLQDYMLLSRANDTLAKK